MLWQNCRLGSCARSERPALGQNTKKKKKKKKKKKTTKMTKKNIQVFFL